MTDVIRSVRQFRKQLKVGDVFWHMRSWHCKPYDIEGPCRVLGFSRSKQLGFETVEYEVEGGGIEESSIGDLTNKWHGVFMNAADAYAYFDERAAAYNTDQDSSQGLDNARMLRMLNVSNVGTAQAARAMTQAHRLHESEFEYWSLEERMR